jgi:RNA polymerase sigma factor (TIGR02999 family)
MASKEQSRITRLLNAVSHGDVAAHEQLWSLVYEELRILAHQQMARESPGRTLQPTALVHEAYMRLVGSMGYNWASRRQFFAAAAKAMRRLRIDDARKRRRLKRGGGCGKPDVAGEEPAIFDQDPAEALAVDEALTKLEKTAPRAAAVVTQRYFAGLTVRETAEVLGLSVRAVEYDWQFARAWLHRALSDEPHLGDGNG